MVVLFAAVTPAYMRHEIDALVSAVWKVYAVWLKDNPTHDHTGYSCLFDRHKLWCRV